MPRRSGVLLNADALEQFRHSKKWGWPELRTNMFKAMARVAAERGRAEPDERNAHITLNRWRQAIEHGKPVYVRRDHYREILEEWQKESGIQLFAEFDVVQPLRLADRSESIPVELVTDTPSVYYDELKSAKELWTSGLNLRRLLDEHEEVFEEILDRSDGHIRVLLLDQAEKRYGTIQENGVDADEAEYAATIAAAARKLRGMSKGRPGKLELRYVNFAIQAGLDLINPRSDTEQTPNWIVYVRFYQIRKCRLEDIDDETTKRTFGTYEDRPIMRLSPENPKHKDLFLYYKRQFTTLWKERKLSAARPAQNHAKKVRG